MITGESLTGRLHALRRRLLGLLAVEALAGGAALALWALTLAGWLDAALDLEPAVRLLLLFAAVVGLPLVAVQVALSRLARADDASLAARVDRALDSGGVVSAGVDLADAAPAAPLRAQLASVAVRHAAEACARVAPQVAVPDRDARRAAVAMGVAAALLALLALVRPAIVALETARLLDPLGDHPSAHGTQLTVEPGRATVTYGDSMDVTARWSGAPPESIEMEIAEEVGPPATLPLYQQDDVIWRAQLAGVRRPFHYRLRAPRGSTRWFAVDVRTVPRIERIDVRVEPPSYTGRTARDLTSPASGIDELAGARLSIRLTSNRPLSGARLELEGPPGTVRRLAATIDAADRRRVTATFALAATARFRARVVDEAGVASRDAFEMPLRALQDEPPTVRLVEPLPESLASSRAVIPVVIEASDDQGLARAELYRSLNGSPPLCADLLLPDRNPRRLQRTRLLDLAPYGLEAGDVIELDARVADAKPGAPGTARTGVARITIVPDEQMRRLARRDPHPAAMDARYRALRRRMEQALATLRRAAAEAREARARGDAARERDAQSAVPRALEQLRAAREACADLARSPIHLDVERALRLQMLEAERRLDHLERRTEARGRDGVPTPLDPDALAHEVEEIARDLDRRTVSPMIRIAAVYALLEDASRFSALYLMQRHLARELDDLRQKRRRDPGIGAELAERATDQRDLAKRLQVLLDDIAEHIKNLPAEPGVDQLRREAATFAQRVPAEKIPEAMAEAAVALERAELATAADAAARAGAKMSALVEHANNMTRPGGAAEQALGFKPHLGSGGTLGQLNDIASRAAERSAQGEMGLYTEGGAADERDETGEESASEGRPRDGTAVRHRLTSNRLSDPTRPEPAAEAATAGLPLRELPPTYVDPVRAYLQGLADDLAREERR